VLSGFYQLLFKGSQQSLEVGSQDMQAFLPGSDLSFTVDSISFMAREAINDVGSGVDAVRAAYTEGRMLIALERIQETFFLGEYLSDLNQITQIQRRSLLDLYRGMLEARELAEAKDYKGVKVAVEALSELAKDFPKSRVNASVEAAMSMSDMAVFAASQYRNVGQIDRAREELRTAIEIWPSNPSIREFQQETTTLATAGAQGERIFDDMVERGDRRGIYDRRMELGFALSEDTERRPLLLEIIDSVARADMMIAQASELDKQGESYAAWELLERAREIDQNDGPMNRARAELAPRVANFIGYVDKAKMFHAAGKYASALTAYLTAQDIYPASRACRLGIAETTDALIDFLSAEAIQSE
jgi:tetratricopeptide (TPR) repeat protein